MSYDLAEQHRHTYRARDQQPATVKVYQAKLVYDGNGKPVRQPGELMHTFTVTGASVDERRAKALAQSQTLTGTKRVSISCTTDGGFSVTIPPKL